MPQPFLLLVAANLDLSGFLGWKWSLWHVSAWLVVQQSKYVFFLNLNVSINDMKSVWPVCITPQPCHSHIVCWWLPICPSWVFGLKMKFMACASLVGSIMKQRYLFPNLIWYYQLYEILMNCLNYTSAVAQPFLLLIAANWPHGENEGYGLCRLGWRYNGEKLYISWPYMLV